MGTVISKAAGSFASVLGNSIVAPIKTFFSRSCEGVCQGTWELICFIEHLCISNLLRLLMVAILTYITLLFFYLLFKVGILQCLVRSLCKMTWAACASYCRALEGMSCFLWHKLKNTKRVYRRRLEDMEEGYNRYSSTEDDEGEEDDCNNNYRRVGRGRWSVRDRRRDRVRRSLYPTSSSLKGGRRSRSRSGSHLHHHHVRLKTREVSVHVKGSESLRHSKHLQVRNSRHRSRAHQLFKSH